MYIKEEINYSSENQKSNCNIDISNTFHKFKFNDIIRKIVIRN